ncbi:putative metal-binding motif-containing protein [Corallococcus aberystwythensis]|uniref:Kelch-like protein n=1 Tax=Corallococcus aberystwythensis TaxID=2316722 RepID=A0A3A8Q6P2_9BACT|nr:putative metal-binding motif-containing protein [Corallococcus aberystwythensis]RKH64307.1 hypothetical protein D7W81_18920 [Corallococcus aberystwythensis]
MSFAPLRAALVLFVLASVACTDFDLEKQKLCDQLPERCSDADGNMGDWKGGALNLTIGYSGFTRGCVTVTATDADNAGNTNSLDVAIPGKTPGTLSVAVFRKKNWGRMLNVTTQLREIDCSGTAVGEAQKTRAQVPEEGTLDVALTLRAIDADGDGYFSSVSTEGGIPGTDCDDRDRAVNPIATEVCNNKDDNCVDEESDAADIKTFYADVDGDGFGSDPVQSCFPRAGLVADNTDCNDNDAFVKPGPSESRCDGVDENCNGMTDERFDIGKGCEDELKCDGAYACATQSQNTCVRSAGQNPVAWFVDDDGDGSKGQSVGSFCKSPVTGSASTSDDCDESSVYVRNGLTEACDRLDNNCSGQVDEGCGTLTWTTNAGVEGTENLTAIAIYDEGRKAWIVGMNKLVHLDNTAGTSTLYPDASCKKDWKAVWATADGRVFAVAVSGEIMTRRPDNPTAPCFAPDVPGSPSLHGITGIERPGVEATAYAVSSSGKIFKWKPPYSPVNENLSDFGTVPGNLRAIASAQTEGSLLAVGGDSNSKAVAYRYETASSTWKPESLGGTFDGHLKGIHVTDSRFAYAAGDNGLVFKRSGGAWIALPPLTEANGTTTIAIRDVLAFSEKGIYVATVEGDIHFYNGSGWTIAYSGTTLLSSLDGPSPTRIGAVGNGSTLVRLTAP